LRTNSACFSFLIDGGKCVLENGAFRKKKVYFSQVSNSALRDKELSLKAKGLYALIQSYITIEGFTLYKSMLLKECKESKTAFDRAWKELIDSGYLKQYKTRAAGGLFCYEYELLDVKEPQNAENSVGQPEPQNRGVANRDVGNKGVYNNTNKKNTDLNNTNLENNTPEQMDCSGEAEEEPDEVAEFVDYTYPTMYEECTGEQHPLLSPVQRRRTIDILRAYLAEQVYDVETLKEVAEEFLLTTHTDGNIRAFATRENLDIMFRRSGNPVN
jgi:hypothetical protein